MNKVKLTAISNITTGKLDSNAAVENGIYPYFTCAPEPLHINEFVFDCDAILLAGNNASGNFHCQRYKGKFNAYQRTYVITAKDGYDIDYIYYNLLISLQNLKKVSQGSQTKFLTMQILDSFEIENVEIDKQIAISKILANLDKKIRLNEKINSELDLMAKTIYDYWFLQYDFPDENGKPYKSSGGKMVWNEELKRGIPNGWAVKSIREFVNIRRGISYTSEQLKRQGIPMINLNSFNTNGTYKAEGIKNYGGQVTKGKTIRAYDLLICATQQTAIDPTGVSDVIGKAIIVPDIFDDEVVTSTDVVKLNVQSNYSKYILRMLVNSEGFHKYITGFANGTKIKHLDVKGILEYKVCVPPKAVQHRFDLLLNICEEKKSKVIKENQELVYLRDFLLPLLMNEQVGFK